MVRSALRTRHVALRLDRRRLFPEDQVIRAFEEYVANRNHFSRVEARWPASPFWARRQERASFPAGRARRQCQPDSSLASSRTC